MTCLKIGVTQTALDLGSRLGELHTSMPIFDDCITVLKGHFGMSLSVKIFMTFWLGMVALFAAGFWLLS
jgi:hypothetical protein